MGMGNIWNTNAPTAFNLQYNVYTGMFPRSASLTARGPSLLCEAELLAAHLGLASLDPGAATTTALARVLGDKYGYRVD